MSTSTVNGKVYAIGGAARTSGGHPGTKTVYLYDPNPEPCDFDYNGDCDIADLNAMLAWGDLVAGVPLRSSESARFDLNGDAVLDQADLDQWLGDAANLSDFASPYKRADANLDGTVDVSDFNNWNAGKFTNLGTWDFGDFDGDGFTGDVDFNFWNANKFTSSAGVATVPEPSWLIVLIPVMIVAGKLVARRRR